MMYFDSPLDNMEQVTSATALFAEQQDQEQLYELYLKELSPEQQMLLPRYRLANYETARQYHLDAIANSQEKKAELDANTAELDAQIAELDRQIADIYARWNAGKQ
jgi:septal ring factor EnvC (AmiA/AmiB activator)